MPKLAPTCGDGPSTIGNLWWRWRGYAVRWLLFCLIVQLFQPVPAGDGYWQFKFEQALLGLAFGAACALVFTAVENTFNVARSSARTWLFVALTWIAVKVLFVSAMSAVQ